MTTIRRAGWVSRTHNDEDGDGGDGDVYKTGLKAFIYICFCPREMLQEDKLLGLIHPF